MRTLLIACCVCVLSSPAWAQTPSAENRVLIRCDDARYAARCDADHAEMAKALDALPPSTQVLDTGLPEVIPLHNYPYGGKTQYDTRAEWLSRFWSAQGHWLVNGMLTHTHVECGAPIYARIPKTTTFTLPCRAQLFHNPGTLSEGYGNDPGLAWADPEPRTGDPTGLRIYHFSATFDHTIARFAVRPENGWYTPTIALFTTFEAHGAIPQRMQNTSLLLPFYMVGDPGVPETPSFPLLASRVGLFGAAFGEARVECYEPLPILAPVSTVITVKCFANVYARDRSGLWPSPQFDRQAQFDDLDLHVGIPGRIVSQHFAHDINDGTFFVTFDPFVQAGPRKTAITWSTNSGPGDPAQGILPNEELWGLLVFNWTAGAGAPPPPPPPPDPVPCGGTWGWSFTDNANQRFFTRVFTVSPSSPSNCVRPNVPSGG